MKKTYNKLVRDRIPAIIEADGGRATTEILSEEAYLAALEEKLREELEEYYRDGSVEELADLLEVIYATASARGTSPAELEGIRAEKAARRGAFAQRILLRDVEE